MISRATKNLIFLSGVFLLFTLTVVSCNDEKSTLPFEKDLSKMSTKLDKANLASLDKIKDDSKTKPQMVVFLRHFG